MRNNDNADRKTFIVGLLMFALFGFLFLRGGSSGRATPTPTPTPIPIRMTVFLSDQMVVISHDRKYTIDVEMEINGKWRKKAALAPGNNTFQTRDFTERDGTRFDGYTTRLNVLQISRLDARGFWQFDR